MKHDISNIVDEIISAMDTSIALEYDPITFKWMSCDTKWARLGKTMTNSVGGKFRITAIEPNEWIEATLIQGTGSIEPIMYLSNPYGLTGTKMVANIEWTKSSNDLMAKTPLIWLLETIRFTEFGKDQPLEFQSDLRLFFLDETNVAQYMTKDHRNNVVQPMNQLIDEFVRTINSNRKFKRILDTERITFSRFGVERDNGVFQNVLDANLSGVELRITLEKYKENCKC